MKIKIATNVPLTGIVASINYRTGLKGWVDSKKPGSPPKDLPDQIELVGSWDNHGDGSVFLDTWAIAQLASLGLLVQLPGLDQYGKPQFRVLRQDKIQILKSENGTRKETSFTWAGSVGAVASAIVARQEAGPGIPAAIAVQAMGQAISTENLDVKLVALYKDCWKVVGELTDSDPQFNDRTAFVAAVATLHISRSKLVVR